MKLLRMAAVIRPREVPPASNLTEGNIADITGSKTHIDELAARQPVPDALDMAEANKINRPYAAATRNVVGAGRVGG